MDKTGAEKKIAAILSDLEAETGQVVDALSITSLQWGSIGDTKNQTRRAVSIELCPKPGVGWDK